MPGIARGTGPGRMPAFEALRDDRDDYSMRLLMRPTNVQPLSRFQT